MDEAIFLSQLYREAVRRALEHLREIARQTQLGEAFRGLPISKE